MDGGRHRAVGVCSGRDSGWCSSALYPLLPTVAHTDRARTVSSRHEGGLPSGKPNGGGAHEIEARAVSLVGRMAVGAGSLASSSVLITAAAPAVSIDPQPTTRSLSARPARASASEEYARLLRRSCGSFPVLFENPPTRKQLRGGVPMKVQAAPSSAARSRRVREGARCAGAPATSERRARARRRAPATPYATRA